MKTRIPNEIQPDLIGLVLVSHGGLALELLSSAEMICGSMQNVAALCVEPADDLTEFRECVADALSKFAQGAFVLLDIKSGTPFNTVLSVAGDHPVFGIAGVNLPVLIETAYARYNMTLEELSEAMDETVKASFCNLNHFQKEVLGHE